MKRFTRYLYLIMSGVLLLYSTYDNNRRKILLLYLRIFLIHRLSPKSITHTHKIVFIGFYYK